MVVDHRKQQTALSIDNLKFFFSSGLSHSRGVFLISWSTSTSVSINHRRLMLIRRNLKGKVERRIVIPRFVSYKIVCEEIENANK